MNALLRLSRLMDALTDRLGRAARWLVLVMVLISAGNAVSRYAFNASSNAWLEIQWYLFSAIFLLCAGYALLHNQHVRIDVLASRLSARGRAWLELFGTVFFLLPMAVAILWLSWPVFLDAWHSGEVSTNANGLIIWPARLLVPVGFALLVLQALSELVKRIAFLRGLIPDPTEVHGSSNAVGELAESIRKSRELG